MAEARRFTEPAEVADALGIPFSAEQLAAVTAPLEPGVIIAGAGSGKTTVMAARVVWLVGTGAVRPDEVLGLTFTRKAAAELSARVRAALVKAGVLRASGVDDEGEQVVMTYDAFAGRVVSEHGLRLGFEGDPAMITGAARFRLASRVVNRAAGPFDHISRLNPISVTERVLQLDSELQSHLVDARALDLQARRFTSALGQAPLNRLRNVYASVRSADAIARERLELAALVGEYQDLKRHLGVVEFSDQMAMAARLVREVPAVARAMRSQFRVVLLDEYQDTSSAQAQLLQGLFSGPDAESGRGHAVTAVGDPFQAIYGWRGAAASNILRFATDFPRADGGRAHAFSLTVNRRSGTQILTAANAVAEPLRADTSLGEQAADNVLRAPDGKEPGRVEVGRFPSWPEEVAWLCDEVVAAHDALPWKQMAVLTRRNADIGTVHAALTERDVPCEIVGLGGLLGLPEVADVVSTLRLVDDVTANPDVVRLLTGPRWAIGRGDLAALGRRAQQIASSRRGEAEFSDAFLQAVERAVSRVESTELVCLLDAVEDPGPHVTDEVRTRLRAFAAELAGLRRHADEPVLDLVRRVIGTLGLDVELDASPALARRDRRAQLATFVDAVAQYADVDGDASLAGLLAYLHAEQEHGVGLEQAVPTDSDSVKLLTVHKAKGLEWELVFVPALVDQTFPNERVSDNWVTSAAVLPAELRGDADSVPQVADVTDAGFQRYKGELKEQAGRSEDRLAYVALTRARSRLVCTGHWWRPGDVKAKGRSRYLDQVWGLADGVVADAPEPPKGAENPLQTGDSVASWPAEPEPGALALRREAAEAVLRAKAELVRTGRVTADDHVPLDVADQALAWDREIDALLAEARRSRSGEWLVPLPSSLTASQVMLARRDPSRFAAELVRPMPRPPAPAAAFGTRFHAWVEKRFGQAMLPDLDDLELPVDAGAESEEDFRQLCELFAAGQFGDRAPFSVEHPFTLLFEGATGPQQVRGRIDAVYRDGDRWLVVDWKTARSERADPLQLAIYRLAWAEIAGVGVERVRAAFHWVRTDRLDVVEPLPGRDELAALVGGLAAEQD